MAPNIVAAAEVYVKQHKNTKIRAELLFLLSLDKIYKNSKSDFDVQILGLVINSYTYKLVMSHMSIYKQR